MNILLYPLPITKKVTLNVYKWFPTYNDSIYDFWTLQCCESSTQSVETVLRIFQD